jgi:RHS repeat-associated protein
VDGQRVKKTVGGASTYYYFPHFEITGGALTKYYFFNGQRFAMKVGSTLTHLHSDRVPPGRGSTVLETNTSNAQSADQRYYVYGRQRDTGSVVTPHRFTGQKEDGSGLYYYGARYYDPQTGLFLSADTLVPDPGVLFDYNRYLYARANPLKYNDPSGNCIAQGQTDWDTQENLQCIGSAYDIAQLGGLEFIQENFGGF